MLTLSTMHTGYISFCDKLGLNIKSHEVKEKIMNDLQNKYNIRIIRKHYEKLDHVTIQKVQKNPHMACLRTNGNPYYLYLTRYQFVNQCIFIDKKVQSGYYLPRMIINKLRFADRLFERDTLLEGEMVKDIYGNWIFLIHNIIAYQGLHLENDNIIKRLNIVYDILEKEFVQDDTDVCILQVKKYFTCDKLHELVNVFMPTLPYTCRGIYFTPLYMRFIDILYNFDESLIKKVERIKYQEDNTFTNNIKEIQDIVSRKGGVSPCISRPTTPMPATTPPPQTQSETLDLSQELQMMIEKTHMVDVYNLYDMLTKKHVGIAAIIGKQNSRLLQDMFKQVNSQTRLTVTCKYVPRFKKWSPLLEPTLVESCP
jgi:mRNA capping enzyme, catalytic domain